MGLRGFACTLIAAALLLPVSVAAADPGPALSIDASAGRHAISPLIYGWNFAPASLAADISLPVDRRGGNKADTLNWQTGVESTSNDYFFENLPWCWPDCADGWDPFRAFSDQIEMDRTAGAKTLIDVPMLGRVPKDLADDNTRTCSYSVGKYGAQTDADPYDTDCGNGYASADGAPVANDPADTGTAKGPDFQGDWVDYLKNRYGSAADGGVAFYELGNEPGLWNSTHRDWHPDAVGYDELWSKSQALASQIRSHDASASILGFSEWGWPNYFCSSADDLSDGCSADDTDRANHGGTPLVEWLLQQFKDWADNNGGERLIDYLDLHYYRQDGGSAGTRATRSLWDPTYTDESWIGDQIQLLPRMHKWVDDNYPGTKIALSEYDLALDSGDDNTHIDMDNLIQADVLGIFAREQLDLATLWPETTNLGHYADGFRMYRNYDGNHSKFGETFVSSQSGDQSQLAVYGAQRASDGALTLAVINKTVADLTSTVSLAGFAAGSPAQVWRFQNVANGFTRANDQTVASTGFSATFPNRSMTMIVIPPPAGTSGAAGSGTPPGSVTPVGAAPQPSSVPTAIPVAKSCKVPALKKLTLKQAKVKLKKAHCRLGKVTKKASKLKKGRVIATKPKAKTRLKANAKVALVVSRGR